MLTTWQLLLDKMAQNTENGRDTQASFEISELRGLAASVIAGNDPQRDDNLKHLIANAVGRVEQSGWANTAGLAVGTGYNYYARFLRLAGASAWLGIDYEAVKNMPDRPLWLYFYRDDATAKVSLETLRNRLGQLAAPPFGWRPQQVPVPIELPLGADRDATLDAIVAALEHVGQLIDPNGPTYREER